MNAYTYILLCDDGSYYTGSTKDLERRYQEHLSGEGANHTRKHPPIEVLYYEQYDRIDDAFYREKQIQKWNRKKKKALIEGRGEELSILAKKVFRK